MVYRYENSTYNSNHKVIVNLQASNTCASGNKLRRFVVFWTISTIKDKKSAAKFHYIKKTVSSKVVAHSIAFRVVSIYLAGGRPLPPEILPPSDLPSPVNGILWEMLELITQERIAVGSSNLVDGLIT